MTIKELILKEKQYLQILDLEFLLSFIIKKSRNFIFLNPNFILNKNEILEFEKIVKKRKEWFSVAVLIWEKDFFWRTFFVNENVLIPRPDTEILINEVLNIFKNWNLENKNEIKILDIWTWSGIIPITLNLELKKIDKKLEIIWTDISKKALEIAQKNSDKFWLKIKFLESDLLNSFEKKEIFFDIITANLPYIENNYFDKSISKEPDLALFSWEDWLNHYKQLFEELKNWKINFKFLFMEMADFQTEKIAKLFSYFWKTSIFKDLSWKKRIVKVENNLI